MRTLGYLTFITALVTIGALLAFVGFYDEIIGHLESPSEEHREETVVAPAPDPAPAPSPTPTPAPEPQATQEDESATASTAPTEPQESGAPSLSVPLDCDFGEICVIQQYADLAPGPEAMDYLCGPLSYDGHNGTDIRARTWAQMEAGITVTAAAPGVVRAIRDGMEDLPLYEVAPAYIEGRNAGNVVIIDHGNGWETSYAHMKNGSVLVEAGDRIERGQPLGQIGLSGKTEFPHLHFGLRFWGDEIDPFTGRALGERCGQPTGSSLWTPDAAKLLAYQPGGLLDLGFADEPPELRQVAEGDLADFQPTADGKTLIFWSLAWGVRPGDKETLILRAPTGEAMANETQTIEDTKIQWFRYIGRRQPDGGWPKGDYTASYELRRGSQVLAAEERIFKID